MPEGVDLVATDAGGRREQPFLFPWNRRLRHLQGISVRNLNIAPPVSRLRGKTIADDDVPYKSPAKRIKDEAKSLHHSRSSSNLTSPTKKPVPALNKATTTYSKDDEKAVRPGGHRLRRRSTLHWTGASPRQRQQKLEDVAAERMADTWFSIHTQSKDRDPTEAIYISEVMEKNMNPSFRFFDLNASSPQISRSDELRLMLWAKSWRLNEYNLLIDLNVNLRSLQFIGRSLENFRHPLPQNCVLFHLEDGIYTSFTDMPVSTQDSKALLTAGPKHHGEKDTTSSYDALMQLANLDDCIQDAILTRQKMERSIASLLAKHQSQLDSTKADISAQASALTAERAVSTEQKTIRQLSKHRDDLRKSISLRKAATTSTQQSKTDATNKFNDLTSQRTALTASLTSIRTDSTGQLRRIAETLSTIFPIDPLKPTTKSLQFTIRTLPLPNSTFDDTNRDTLSAALCYTAQLTHLLSRYLSTPLPYPLTTTGPSAYTTIADPISLGLASTQRLFPLYPISSGGGGAGYKFEYGVFLLNKNIEVLLMNSHAAGGGLRVLDIRHTLPNLKYLLYVLSAGTGEAPARKKGGVRGLMMGPGRGLGGIMGGGGTPSMSRRGSDESVNSQSSYAVGRVNGGGGFVGAGGKAPGAARKGKVEDSSRPDPDDPFVSTGTSPRAKTMPFRSSLLRAAESGGLNE